MQQLLLISKKPRNIQSATDTKDCHLERNAVKPKDLRYFDYANASLSMTVLGVVLALSPQSYAMMADDPWISFFQADELEYRKDEELTVWDMQYTLGKDLHKWSLEWQGEADKHGIEQSELDLYYSRAFSPYWNGTLGIVHDAKPEPTRTWLQLGFEGTAPYFVESDIDLLLGEDGDLGVRVQLEKELMLTQRWVLKPELEFNVYAQSDAELDQESGLQSVEFGLRLAYEFNRQFAPYLGAAYERVNHLNTADKEETFGVAGLHFWF